MSALATAPLTDVKEFVNGEYFSHVGASLAASTVDGYRKMWRMAEKYFEGRGLNLRTCECQAIMRQICADHPKLRKTSLSHLKNFFSGIWSHALRMGLTENDNPWRVVQIPQAPEPGETHAYTPAEIETLLTKTPKPYDLVVLLAACTGLRKSEIRGLRWSDWDPETSTLWVRRAVWRSHEKETKSKASRAPVPVVPVLAARLNEIMPAGGNKPIFAGSTGKPLDLDNLARRIIVPAVGKTWVGWHAFRRSLATFLNSRGVPLKVIQSILRHSNLSVTERCYVKTLGEDVRDAMSKVNFGCTEVTT